MSTQCSTNVEVITVGTLVGTHVNVKTGGKVLGTNSGTV